MDEKEIKIRFEEIERRLKLLEDVPSEERNSNKKITIKEFILEKNPSKDVQTTLCIAYYLEKYEDKTRVNTPDIKDYFKIAKLIVPKNVADKIYQCCKRGLMAEDKKGEFYVTSLGDKLVESNFEK